MATEAVTFESIKSQLAKRQYAPIYLLHGEEGYYIVAEIVNILVDEAYIGEDGNLLERLVASVTSQENRLA